MLCINTAERVKIVLRSKTKEAKKHRGVAIPLGLPKRIKVLLECEIYSRSFHECRLYYKVNILPGLLQTRFGFIGHQMQIKQF